MRHSTLFLLVLAVVACEAPANMHGLPPPTLSVSAATRVIPVAGADPSLEVSAFLKNGTGAPIQVGTGPSCPLFVQLSWDPTGEPAGSTSSSMACAPGARTLELAPGDTAVLRRVLTADTLTTFVPGTYGVNVAVTTSTAVIGVWAGAVHLPLAGLN